MTPINDKNFICDACSKSFKLLSYLKRHKQSCKGAIYNECMVCGKRFSHIRNFNYHLKKEHGIGVENARNIKKCGLCEFTATKGLDVIQHVRKEHNIAIEKKHYEFQTVADFLSWKTELEQNTTSHYVRESGSLDKSENNITDITYRCHRSGYYKKEGRDLRKLKRQGSCKINAFCPSKIMLRNKSGIYKVTYIQTHVGHDLDIKHIYLSNSERQEIARKIESNIPFPQILHEFHESSKSISHSERINRLTIKDLHNIKKSLDKGNVTTDKETTLKNNLDSPISRCSSTGSEKDTPSLSEFQDVDSDHCSTDDDPDEFKEDEFLEELFEKDIYEVDNSEDSMETHNLEMELENLKDEFCNTVNRISNFKQLNAVKKIIASVDPTIDILTNKHLRLE